MASLLEQAFGGGGGSEELDLYKDVLHVSKDCSQAQLRKAYYKQAMEYHPDKNPSPDAKHKFQAISWTYNYLKDPQKRKDYDEDGIIPQNDDGDDDDDEEGAEDGGGRKSWKDYFDLIFGKLTTNDIDSFAMKYKMSDEEEKDVLENYTKFQGNLVKMLEYVMLSTERDAPRWVEDYIRPAIQAGKVENYDDKLTKSLRKIEKKLQTEQKQNQKQHKKTKSEMQDEDDDINEDDDSDEEMAVAAFDPDETESEDDDDDDVEAGRPTTKPSSATKGKSNKKAAAATAKKAKPTNPKVQKKKKKQKPETTATSNNNNKKKKKSKGSSSSSNSAQFDLVAAIRNKNRGGTNPLSSIAARYGVSMDDDDNDGDPLDDDTFAKLQSKYNKTKKGKGKK